MNILRPGRIYLGGLYKYNGANLDADLLTTTGVYAVNNNMEHLPYIDGYYKGAWGSLVHIEAQYRIQLYCGGTNNQHAYWIRFRTGSAWHPWYKITGTEV